MKCRCDYLLNGRLSSWSRPLPFSVGGASAHHYHTAMQNRIYLSLNLGAIGVSDVPLADKIRLAQTYGFTALDLSPGGPSEPAALQTKQQITEAGLQPGCFGLPLNINAPDAEFEATLPNVSSIAPLAAAAGLLRTGCYMMPSSNTRQYQENFDWYVARYRRLTAILRPHGIELGIEFLGEHLVAKCGKYPFIWDLPGMRKLLDAIGPGAGVIFDLFHWHCSGGTVQTLAEQARGIRITSVHLNDAVPDRPRLEQIDNDRRLPLETGVIDARGALAVLRDLGCDAPAMVEPFKPWTERFAKGTPDEACARVGEACRPLFQ